MKKTLATLVALILLPAAFLAQSSPKEIVLIKAGKLIDVRAGRVLKDQSILIEGDRVKQVGSSQSVQAPAGARAIDLSNATVLPGLIAWHINTARTYLRSEECESDTGSRFHDGSQRWGEWLFRHSAARCHQRRRHP